MKTETYTCDVCENPTSQNKCADARLTVNGDTYLFHVCETCWVTTPKGVFRKAFNRFCRFFTKSKKKDGFEHVRY